MIKLKLKANVMGFDKQDNAKYASEKWKSFHPPCTAMKSFHHSSPQQLLQHQFTCFIDTHYLHTMHILFGDMDLWITSTTWWGVTCMCACSLNNMFAGACTFGANQDAFVGPTLMPRSPRASSSSSKSSSWCPLKRFEIKWGIAQYERILSTHGWLEKKNSLLSEAQAHRLRQTSSKKYLSSVSTPALSSTLRACQAVQSALIALPDDEGAARDSQTTPSIELCGAIWKDCCLYWTLRIASDCKISFWASSCWAE